MTDELAGVFNEFAQHLQYNSAEEIPHDLQIGLFLDGCVNWKNRPRDVRYCCYLYELRSSSIEFLGWHWSSREHKYGKR